MVSATVGGQDSIKHCSKFTCELVHFYTSWLAIDLDDFEFLEALFDVLNNAHGCNRFVAYA